MESSSGGEKRYGRAVFLGTVAGGVSSLFWAHPLWNRLSSALSPVEALVPLVPSGGWRIYTVADTMPTFHLATWRLRVHGLVARPMTLTYAQLRSLPKVEEVRDFHCVTGWSVKNVHWGGVRLRDFLARAAPGRHAEGVRFVSAEKPYTDYLTMSQASLPDVLLAYEMDGKPLSRAHGAPVRLVMPEMYGYKSVKWVESIEVVPRAADGYWEALGYDRDAWLGHSNGYGA
jgi:DMSO/TMAO reductase YedYZ molybdopterin-dependent catalytic subunit